MLPFATEFPVRNSDSRAAFVAEVLAWLRGMKHQTVLSSSIETEFERSNIHIRAESGEELRMRELHSNNRWKAVGMRHDIPDDQGRLWRTECVLREAATEDAQDLIRLRTQCIAATTGAQLETPRKPYLIKSLLKSNWGGVDGSFTVNDQPFWLSNSESDVLLAVAITEGTASHWLPTIYVSSTGDADWLLRKSDIERLAYELGGIAHVIVEPNRDFASELRELAPRKNPYNGTIVLCLPGQGVVRRYYLGWKIQDAKGLIAAIKTAATTLRSQMPSYGWDWSELQEQSLRAQRERDKNRLSAAENQQLYEDEISSLKETIQDLQQRINTRPLTIGNDDEDFTVENLVNRIGPEIYSGEISDRLRLAAELTLSNAEQTGLDQRSCVVLTRILERLPASPALLELKREIKNATKNRKRVGTELTKILCRHGYVEKSDNKHIRLEALRPDDGLDSITLPKTPSESRGLVNLQKQIEGKLGLKKLS